MSLVEEYKKKIADDYSTELGYEILERGRNGDFEEKDFTYIRGLLNERWKRDQEEWRKNVDRRIEVLESQTSTRVEELEQTTEELLLLLEEVMIELNGLRKSLGIKLINNFGPYLET